MGRNEVVGLLLLLPPDDDNSVVFFAGVDSGAGGVDLVVVVMRSTKLFISLRAGATVPGSVAVKAFTAG